MKNKRSRVKGTVVYINDEQRRAIIAGDNGQDYHTNLDKLDFETYVDQRVEFEYLLPVAIKVRPVEG